MPRLNIPYVQAKMIAAAVPKAPASIIAEKWIDTAFNHWGNPAMVALFDIYMESIEGGPADDIMCTYCREQVLSDYRKMKPYLKHLAGIQPEPADFIGPDYVQMYNESVGGTAYAN